HRTSIKDGLGRHIGSCGPLNRNFLSFALFSDKDLNETLTTARMASPSAIVEFEINKACAD
ncbi:hypothetical protein, partial [Citrobacter farmeri]|uniref:hypothetical protein n=1 Tax=Citrobacter farmeri TaxID=67824 RepID=UPI003606332B